MKAKDLAQFKKLLLDMKSKLTNNIDRLQSDGLKTGGETIDELSDVPAEHMAERGTDTFVRDLMVQVLQDSDAELCDVNLALEKIENRTYGLCEHCEEEIGRKRLRALPFARLCIECRQAEEEAGQPG